MNANASPEQIAEDRDRIAADEEMIREVPVALNGTVPEGYRGSGS